jgi:hypothetical protein
MFQVKVIDLTVFCILCYVQNFHTIIHFYEDSKVLYDLLIK